MDGQTEEFSKREASSGLDEKLTRDGLKRMVDSRDYRAVDYIFPFVDTFSNRFIGHVEKL